MKPVLQYSGISFSYGDRQILKGINLCLGQGQRLGLTGPMGSGKSTLLHLAMGLIRPSAGSISAFGRVCKSERQFCELRKRVGLVFQDSDDQLFCPTVLEDVAFGPLNLGFSVSQAEERSANALRQVGLQGFEERVTYRLSGGEKRLVAIATVLAMEPDVLLLDEPQGGLDSEAEARVRALLRSLPQSMIIVAHDPAFLHDVSTRIEYLRDGRLK